MSVFHDPLYSLNAAFFQAGTAEIARSLCCISPALLKKLVSLWLSLRSSKAKGLGLGENWFWGTAKKSGFLAIASFTSIYVFI